ncbi:23S rRNA (cytidine(2498)-2'-O)-methyltransferase RlmM [Catenovulum maritimum]|uniref:Ribosomal RNA large subunit methyltransferase M n=1 Tax=Catenovulum maritimum TaxID=1513271 RepID=A0A0J8GVC5_9ALTE|nr:23S rRNA (cytidine(2498)-2'-O)-methyltransferase RlmM [Catenovulum maritimum]KMT65259.1 23S rRNA methyltransferase [Catenovulum maritimum]
MSIYVLYCRAGFEKDCAAEIQARSTDVEMFGFCRLKDNQGFVEFEVSEPEAGLLFKKIKLRDLVFTRQWIRLIEKLTDLPEKNRLSPILDVIADNKYGDLRLEYPDTNSGKEIANFAKKFTVPLRQALKQKNQLKDKHSKILHLFLFDSSNIWIGISYQSNNSPWNMGIQRLRFPSKAPSRSTLKLEEAFHHFIPKDEWQTRLASGLQAVDLGAAPGGWTYQLVQQSMMVIAIDNGPMAESLMETGQVRHYREDGFKFEPKKNQIYWLVCDMVEKPDRVGQLMCKWVMNSWCKEAIFNLKLPMKQRFQNLETVRNAMLETLYTSGKQFRLEIKHLYHDREEVTCLLRMV